MNKNSKEFRVCHRFYRRILKYNGFKVIVLEGIVQGTKEPYVRTTDAGAIEVGAR
jgi:hypothetical protein